MKRAVRDYNLPGNPVKQIDKPSQRREREPVLVTVEQVNAMRRWCLERGDRRSATLISLLAYAGHAPGVRGAAAALGGDPPPQHPLPGDQARRRLRARHASARPAGRRPIHVARGLRRAGGLCARHPQPPRRAVGRIRLGQLAQPHVPCRRLGGRPPHGHPGRRPTRPAARSALELRDAAHLRGPTAPVRRRAARPQRRHAAARLRARLAGLRPVTARQRRGADRTGPTRRS